jgi:hypothetical protein
VDCEPKRAPECRELTVDRGGAGLGLHPRLDVAVNPVRGDIERPVAREYFREPGQLRFEPRAVALARVVSPQEVAEILEAELLRLR